MGASGSDRRRGRRRWAATLAIVATLALASACGTATTDAPAGLGLGSPGPGGQATVTSGTSDTGRPTDTGQSTPAPRAPTPAPAPKPAACRGAIPSSASALRGPLRAPTGPTTTATIWYVVDGDTIRLTDKEYVRLIGIDTPETVKPGTPVQPYGPQASADAKRLLAGHTTVTLEKDVSDTDYYGRLLRFVWIRSGNSWFQLDYELVVRGDARLDTIRPDVRYAADYAAAQALAQAHHVGRWATC
ncbi:MAG: thermonuclease family protein [Candidatus Limnocylindrales bacterium]